MALVPGSPTLTASAIDEAVEPHMAYIRQQVDQVLATVRVAFVGGMRDELAVAVQSFDRALSRRHAREAKS